MIFWKRKFKYQWQYCKRYAGCVRQGMCLPKWLCGTAARVCYLILLVGVSVMYIGEISSATKGGYEMRDLQRKVETLRDEIQSLNVKVAQENALPSLKKRIENSELAKVQDIIYLNAVDVMMAKR